MTIDPRRVVKTLGTLVACLVLLDLAFLGCKYLLGHDHMLGLAPMFDVDTESNVPTLFSTVQLLLCAGLLAFIATAARAKRERGYRYWSFLAATFVFLAIDEATSVHEAWTEPLRPSFDHSGLLHFAWVVPYGVAAIVMAAFYAPFVMRLPNAVRRGTIVAGALYLSGALGCELLGGLYYDHLGQQDAIYGFIVLIEESLEMVGVLVFIHALLLYIAAQETNGIRVGPAPEAPGDGDAGGADDLAGRRGRSSRPQTPVAT